MRSHDESEKKCKQTLLKRDNLRGVKFKSLPTGLQNMIRFDYLRVFSHHSIKSDYYCC